MCYYIIILHYTLKNLLEYRMYQPNGGKGHFRLRKQFNFFRLSTWNFSSTRSLLLTGSYKQGREVNGDRMEEEKWKDKYGAFPTKILDVVYVQCKQLMRLLVYKMHPISSIRKR